MKNALIALAVVLVGGLAYFLLRPASPAAPTATPPAQGVEVIQAVKVDPLPPVAAPVTPPSELETDAGAMPTRAVAGTGGGLKIAGPALTPAELADLKLDRTLTGDHTFTQAGRLHAVLGTKNAASPTGGTQPLLVTRDQVSGQITYSLSALQFTLNGGVDPEAFISEHARFHKLFVNPVYLQVDVDAADIAAELDSAAHDSRVAKVGFVPAPVVKSPR